MRARFVSSFIVIWATSISQTISINAFFIASSVFLDCLSILEGMIRYALTNELFCMITKLISRCYNNKSTLGIITVGKITKRI